MTHHPTRDELARLTNLDELAPPLAKEEEVPLADTTPPVGAELPKRSTTDAFESNFGQVDLVAGLQKPGVPVRARRLGWILLGVPCVVAWLASAFGLLDGASEFDAREWLVRLELLAVITVVTGFWPYFLLKSR
jgi:hypothetical protein